MEKTTLITCWKNLWEGVLLRENDEDKNWSACAHIFQLVSAIGEEGFEDFNSQDDSEFFEDSILDDDQIVKVLDGNNNDDENEAVVDACNGTGSLTASQICQGLKKATDLENHLLTQVSNEKRSEKFQRDIKKEIECYSNLYM